MNKITWNTIEFGIYKIIKLYLISLAGQSTSSASVKCPVGTEEHVSICPKINMCACVQIVGVQQKNLTKTVQ